MSEQPGTPAPSVETQMARRAERRIGLARAALFWENLWPRLAPALAIVAGFATLSLIDFWDTIGWQAHLALFGLALVALATSLWWRLRDLRWPDHAAGRRRLELASGFPHRPLELLADRLAGEPQDGATAALWQAHRRRMLARIGQIKVGVPRAGIARLDHNGIRAIFGLLLLVSLADAGTEAPRRLVDGLTPDIGGEARARIALEAWLGPPAYTGLPPIFLTRDEKATQPASAAIDVPAGSTLLARVHGARKAPVLLVDGKETAFTPLDAQNFQASLPLNAGKRIAVRAGSRDLGAWTVNIVADKPPVIRFKEPPKPSNRMALQLSYEASDDYGLKRVAAEIRRDGSNEVLPVDLPLNLDKGKATSETSFHDLTSHPWAGLSVSIRLIAEDGIGQIGESEAVSIVMPEREFRHPVARAVVEQRRALVRTPERRPIVAAVLGALALAPEMFNDDTTVHLGLRTARSRLAADRSEAATKEVQDLLWDVALRIEDGNLSQAEKEMRDAQARLQEALSRNAPDAEIEKLISELKQALDKFMQALAQQAIERAERGEQDLEEADEDGDYLTSEDLQKMIDRARDMARQGARDAAKDMLSQLQQMLESLKSGKVARAPDQKGGRQQSRRGNQQMQELGEMMRKQQELMDRSFRQQRERQQGQRGQPGQQGQQGQQPGDGAGEQEALRRQLGEMLRKLQEGGMGMPDALRRAEDQMGAARDALRGGEPGQATGPQGQALDLMRQGAQAMMQQLMDQYGTGQDPGGDPNGDRRDRADAGRQQEDPLGRDFNNQWDEGLSTKVPTQSELQRSREILEELYRRSGERLRPQAERDYLDRLLRRF